MKKKIKILLYCTKDKNNRLYRYYGNKYDVLKDKQHTMPQPDFFMNGKIVAECEIDKVEEIHISIEKTFGEEIKYYIYDDEELENYYREDCVEKETCLKCNEISNYLNKRIGYFLHLSNVKMFDKPKELSEYLIFNGDNTNIENWKPNKHAPQNMKVVYEFCEYNEGILLLPKRTLNKCILISVQPQHLCEILNGEKTIEVRKQILNCLKELM